MLALCTPQPTASPYLTSSLGRTHAHQHTKPAMGALATFPLASSMTEIVQPQALMQAGMPHNPCSASVLLKMMFLRGAFNPQAKVDALSEELRTQGWAAAKSMDDTEQALMDERRDILTRSTSTVRCKGGPHATTTAVPLFWLRALRASESAGLAVARCGWGLWRQGAW